MKKLVSILALVMCVILLLSFASCGEFMSSAAVKKVVKEFGNPQAEMTINFTTTKGNKFKYVITYDLLLEKTPITVINFINLVEKGFYNDTCFESHNSTNNYFLASRYSYRKNSEGKASVAENISEIAMSGEFKTNGYREPVGGYEEFSLFSLAMYHDADGKKFDTANGALIFSTASSSSEKIKSLNYTNYAVFAKAITVSVYLIESEEENLMGTYSAEKVSSLYLENLTKRTSSHSSQATTSDGTTKQVTIWGSSSNPLVISIKMLGDKDWTKLPKVN